MNGIESVSTLTRTEIRLGGKNLRVPAVEIAGRTVIATGRWFRVSALRDQELAAGELVRDPAAFLTDLKNSGLNADVFTFFQRPPAVEPKFPFHFERDNYAAVTINTFEAWWEKLPQGTRKNVRRATKRGLAIRTAAYDDSLARGIHKLCNESPLRQGKPFWHYGKDFETIRREHATYVERSEFIGAFLGDELVGFIKLVFVDQVAFIVHILASDTHLDKWPMNALVAKAVEVCVERKIGYLVYDKYFYGNKKEGSLLEFKHRNGFEPVYFPRYYVPLTWKGRIFVALKLYRGAVGLLPASLLKPALRLRAWFYTRKHKSAEAEPLTAGIA